MGNRTGSSPVLGTILYEEQTVVEVVSQKERPFKLSLFRSNFSRKTKTHNSFLFLIPIFNLLNIFIHNVLSLVLF